uniref:Uncharacterized protein n=1 Tax=Fagus sylvatica TaxID=28930 RepID=A0A2N9GSE4_FAGSY
MSKLKPKSCLPHLLPQISGSSSQTYHYPLLSPSTHLQIKLTKDNYLSWKTTITPYINGNKILHHIDGTSLPPPQYISSTTSPPVLIPNPAYPSWFEIDQLLLSILISTISDTLVSSIVGLTSSRAVWATLEKMFSSQSRAPKQYSDLLASIGQPLSDNDLIIHILNGLPTEYDSLVTTNAVTPDLGIPTAHFPAKPPGNSSRGHQHSSSSNHGFQHCGRGRHSSSRGRPNGGSANYFSNNSSHGSCPFCQICLTLGHTAPSCWHRFEQNFHIANGSSSQAYVAATTPVTDQVWYPDTSATNHMTADLQNLNLSAEDYTGQDQVRVGNGQGLYIHHIGSSILCSSNQDFFLKNILHVPSISQNLLSVYQFAKDNNVFFEFHPSFFCIKDLFSGATLLRGKSKDGLYPLHSLHQIETRALIGECVSLAQWHARLGHPSLRVVRQVLSNHQLAVSTNKTPSICHACQLGKSHSSPILFVTF